MVGWIPLIIMVICHCWVGIDLIYHDDYPMAIVFLAYAIATVGLLWKIYLDRL